MKKFFIFAVPFLLAACANQQQPATITNASQLYEPGTITSTAVPVTSPQTEPLLSQTHFYFKLSSSRLDSKYLPALKAHAAYIKQHSDASILLIAYTDASGNPKFNKALAMRRAEAVAKQLEMDGVPKTKIRIVDYGVAPVHTGVSPEENRRVDLMYQ